MAGSQNCALRGRGLAAIHDRPLRAELRTAAGHAAVAAALGALRGTPERSGGRHRSWRRRTANICDAGGALPGDAGRNEGSRLEAYGRPLNHGLE
ncbi:hypothetical protein NDU88_001849 [Pleurodeles waltl]|uniref:Uncharacterized protein n=1 Tax=Pleurodeles waltl TaxID=8319 RepID=A0AAV7LIP5_PLEWA|nr:hypothetical protein NDU88_001849 [Pleurodeles waltl]